MSHALMMVVMPPGEMEQFTCERCACTQFQIYGESRDGKIQSFHTVCAACGKRGALSIRVETQTTHEFVQFMDPTEGSPRTPTLV